MSDPDDDDFAVLGAPGAPSPTPEEVEALKKVLAGWRNAPPEFRFEGGPYPGDLHWSAAHALDKSRPPFVCRGGPEGWHRYLIDTPYVYRHDGPCASEDHLEQICEEPRRDT